MILCIETIPFSRNSSDRRLTRSQPKKRRANFVQPKEGFWFEQGKRILDKPRMIGIK